jgi:hypothetical protein
VDIAENVEERQLRRKMGNRKIIKLPNKDPIH